MNYFGSFGKDDKQALERLIPVLDQALHAHQVGDYQAFLSVITPELAEQISEDGFAMAFQELAPQLGKLESKSFLAALRRQDNPLLLFAARFAATGDDVLIQAMFKNGTEPPLIDSFWIE